MTAINAAYCTAGALAVARGAADPTSTGWPEPNGGMVDPKRVHLSPGHRYFRFADGAWPAGAQRYGGWWIEFETLHSIAGFAREHADARSAVRYLLALPWAWSAVDRLVHGILVAPVDAYRGVGRVVRTDPGGHVRDAGTRYIPPQHLGGIYQLYVPGMREIGSRAFPHLAIEDVWSSSYFRTRAP